MSGKVGPVKPVNHTSLVTVITPTDRPKSVHNHCVIELFGDMFVLSRCPFDMSVGIGAFVVGLIQISSFFSLTTNMIEVGCICKPILMVVTSAQSLLSWVFASILLWWSIFGPGLNDPGMLFCAVCICLFVVNFNLYYKFWSHSEIEFPYFFMHALLMIPFRLYQYWLPGEFDGYFMMK